MRFYIPHISTNLGSISIILVFLRSRYQEYHFLYRNFLSACLIYRSKIRHSVRGTFLQCQEFQRFLHPLILDQKRERDTLNGSNWRNFWFFRDGFWVKARSGICMYTATLPPHTLQLQLIGGSAPIWSSTTSYLLHHLGAGHDGHRSENRDDTQLCEMECKWIQDSDNSQNSIEAVFNPLFSQIAHLRLI